MLPCTQFLLHLPDHSQRVHRLDGVHLIYITVPVKVSRLLLVYGVTLPLHIYRVKLVDAVMNDAVMTDVLRMHHRHLHYPCGGAAAQQNHDKNYEKKILHASYSYSTVKVAP